MQGNTLFESYHSNLVGDGLESQCAVHWDLTRVYPPEGPRRAMHAAPMRPGYPISALLFNADEIYAAIQSQGDIGHAIRFILPNDRMKAGEYVHPATHAGGPQNNGRICDSVWIAISPEGGFRRRRILPTTTPSA